MDVKLSRRNFLKSAAFVGGGLVTATLVRDASAQTGGGDLQSVVSNNHGHAFVMTATEFFANGPRRYDIRGTSTHPHTLIITQEILDTLDQTRVVDVVTTIDASHAHSVRLKLV